MLVTAGDNNTCVCVRHSEILRVVDSLQLTARQKVATPVDWEVTANQSTMLENHSNHSYLTKHTPVLIS